MTLIIVLVVLGLVYLVAGYLVASVFVLAVNEARMFPSKWLVFWAIGVWLLWPLGLYHAIMWWRSYNAFVNEMNEGIDRDSR